MVDGDRLDAAPNGNNGAPAPRPRRRRRRPATALLIVVILVGVPTALHFNRRSRPTRPSLGHDGRYAAADRKPTGPSAVSPEALLAPLGLTPTDDVPADLAMPEGATLRSLVRRSVFGGEQIKAEYVLEGDVAAVRADLIRRLAAAGWRPVRSASDREAPARLLLYKWPDSLTMHLNQEGRWVMITAVIQRAASDPPAAGS